MIRRILLIVALTLAVGLIESPRPAIGAPKPPRPVLRFAEPGRESIRIHNRIAAYLLRTGMGYETAFVSGDPQALNRALVQGGTKAVNVNMEAYSDRWPELYSEAEALGREPGSREGLVNLGPSHPGVQQGFFVPAYLIRGDEKRQLKPVAPQLKKVADLKGLWELFRDPDQPLKGRFWGAVPGWLGQKNVQTKFKSYGLDERFRLVEPTSGPALEQSVERAYHAGEPWVGYYWTPDALTARLDLVMLEEPPFDKWTWEDTRACAFPASEADVIVHKSLLKTAPDAVKFLTRYDMPTEVHNRLLTRQREVREPLDATVEWFMREYPSLWPRWTTFWAAENIRESRKRGTGTR